MTTIGQAIAEARKSKGYTLKELSEKSGIASSTLSYWEHDESIPSINLLWDVADTLGVPLDTLVGRVATGVSGEWKTDPTGKPYCSHCKARPLYMKGADSYRRVTTPYCPRCGARLKGGRT